MTSTVSCEDADKEWFDEFQQSGENQAQAFSRLVENAKAYNGDLVDTDELAEETADKMGPKLELALFRVADEMRDAQ